MPPEAETGWRAVRLGEARQVAELMGRHPDDAPAPDTPVEVGYRRLRDAADPAAAVDYLAHALPRLEAVGWAAAVVRDASAGTQAQRAAHDMVERWLDERSDAHRRAARDAGLAIGRHVAERFLADAVFHAGGSLADLGEPEVHAPPHATARFAAAAIHEAVLRTGDRAEGYRAALALGEAIAERGLPPR